jgi:hypothetical protein
MMEEAAKQTAAREQDRSPRRSSSTRCLARTAAARVHGAAGTVASAEEAKRVRLSEKKVIHATNIVHKNKNKHVISIPTINEKGK